MKRLFTVVAMSLAMLINASVSAESLPKFVTEPETLASLKNHHVQGVCATDNAVYMTWKGGIYKIGWDGKLIKEIVSTPHTGDICCHNGTIYVGVTVGKMGDYHGKIITYDLDLNLLKEYDVDREAEAITICGDYIYFGAGPNTRIVHNGFFIGKAPLSDITKVEYFTINPGFPMTYGAQHMETCGENLVIDFYSTSATKSVVISPTESKVLSVMKFSATWGFCAMPKSIAGERKLFARLKKASSGTPVRLLFQYCEYDGTELVRVKK